MQANYFQLTGDRLKPQGGVFFAIKLKVFFCFVSDETTKQTQNSVPLNSHQVVTNQPDNQLILLS